MHPTTRREGDICAPLPYSKVRTPSRARFENLAADENPDIRASVASHPEIPRDIWQVLACDEDSFVRQWAARNYSNTEEDLAQFEHDSDQWVRAYVGWKKSGSLSW